MTELQQEKEAQRQQFLFEEECKAGAFTTSGNIKFQALAEQWFREAAGKTNRPLSLQRLHTYEKRTYAAIGHLRVDKINTRTVQLFMDNLSEEGVSEKTLHALPKEAEGETVLRKVLCERGLAQNVIAKQAGLGWLHGFFCLQGRKRDLSMTKSLFPEKEKARKALNIKAFRALQPGADDGT